MRQLRLQLWDNVFTHDIRLYGLYLWNRMEDFSTLFLGETGTGKGTAAAAIGRSGFIPFDEKKGCFVESFMRNFIPVNLSLYPEALIESELFGHKKGAFTGAIDHHHGVFARCSPHGAIFLDEIGDVTVPVQVKLLQVLQDRMFSPVGSHERMRFSGRVIAATNRPLDELRGEGLLRNDFYYRLCSDSIMVPPLRQRLQEDPGEMNLILGHIVSRLTGGPAPELVSKIQGALGRDLGPGYSWPGNVRELEQASRRILLKGEYRGERASGSDDLMTRLLAGIQDGAVTAQQVLSAYCKLLYRTHGTYEEAASRAGLDRRTVKRYIRTSEEREPDSGPKTR